MAYRYYSTQRPVGIGTYPYPFGNKVSEIHNFDYKEPVKSIHCAAWGWIEFEKPLEERDWKAYELVPEVGNGVEWICCFRDEMETVTDNEDNLVDLLVPTSWVKANIACDYDWYRREATADTNVGLYCAAVHDGVILCKNY